MKSNLNEKQKEAVYLDFGPALILAGPGSGKTTVILERIKYLIYELNISPKDILVITYTKSAALEMKTRAAKILDISNETPFFGTFHSYFYSVLKRSYQFQNFSIMTKKQKFHILEGVLKVYYPNMRISNNLMMDIFSCISKLKNNINAEKDIERIGFSIERFIMLQKKFEYTCKEQKVMDYDDILLFAMKLFKENQDILEKIRQEAKYILVDEFQDVNQIQYELIYLIVEKRGNIFVVGDDDQSIYRFRGAGEENLRRFETDFCAVQKVVLDINYRCPGEIVSLSSRLIGHNEMRFKKELCSGKKEKGTIICKRFKNKEDERKYVVGCVKELISRNRQQKTAILCRTNSQLGILAEMMKKENIKYYKKEKTINFYELPCIKPIIGYLMFATGLDRSRKRLLTFLNQPMRYIDRGLFANWDASKQVQIDQITTEEIYIKKALVNLQETLKRISRLSPEIAVSYILKAVGYEEFAKAKCKNGEELESFRVCLKELKERARMYSDLRQWMEFIRWEENTETLEMQEQAITDEKVFLYTFHGAKGLEFDTVFILHLNEGSVPYGKNLTQEELEEERRMFYVAITRSSEKLYITFVENDTKKDTASRFLKECGLTASNNSQK